MRTAMPSADLYRSQRDARGRREAYRKLRTLYFHAIAREVMPQPTVVLKGYPDHATLMEDYERGFTTD